MEDTLYILVNDHKYLPERITAEEAKELTEGLGEGVKEDNVRVWYGDAFRVMEL